MNKGFVQRSPLVDVTAQRQSSDSPAPQQPTSSPPPPSPAIYSQDKPPLKTSSPASPSLDIDQSPIAAHAIFNKEGDLTTYSTSFLDVFQIIADLITPGASFAKLMEALVTKAGKYLDKKEREDWRKGLKDYQSGPKKNKGAACFDFTGLGPLRIRSQRQELQDGSQLYSFDSSPALQRTLNEIIHLNRQVLSAMEDINEGFILYDNHNRLIYSNARHRALYPEVAHMFVPGTDRQEILDAYWEKVKNKTRHLDQGTRKNQDSHKARGNHERLLPNGSWIQINEKQTQGGGIVAVRTDITDLKANQSALSKLNVSLQEQAVELETATKAANQATEAKTNFLATMSHEIRTPLNGVIGMTQLLLGSDLDSDQQAKLDTIITSGQSLLEIINDILDMSKIEAGNVELELTNFDLPTMLKTSIAPLKSLAEEKGLYLKSFIKTPTPYYIKSNGTRLRQILTNLIGNAIKFTLSGGISLTLEELSSNDHRCKGLPDPTDPTDPNRSDTDRPGSGQSGDINTSPRIVFLSLAVRDTGTGIAENRIESIFNSFTQEDNTITRRFGGTGLGLAIVKSLAELFGGRVTVASKLNLGSCFEVIFPCELPSEEEIHHLQNLSKPLEDLESPPLNILIAEDNIINAAIAKAFMVKFGHTPYLAINGAKAIDVLAKEEIDFIFMDIHMPKMDGIEATIKIRNGKVRPDIPIIGLTAEAFSERHAHFRDIGMNEVLSKPFTEQQLKSIIARNFNLNYREPANNCYPNGQVTSTQDRIGLEQRDAIAGRNSNAAGLTKADTGSGSKICT